VVYATDQGKGRGEKSSRGKLNEKKPDCTLGGPALIGRVKTQ